MCRKGLGSRRLLVSTSICLIIIAYTWLYTADADAGIGSLQSSSLPRLCTCWDCAACAARVLLRTTSRHACASARPSLLSIFTSCARHHPFDAQSCLIQHSLLQAAQCFHEAARAGHPDAAVELGACYAAGRGVAADKTRAFEWYWYAAQSGSARAEVCSPPTSAPRS